MEKKKSVPRIMMERLIGLLVFLIALAIANIGLRHVQNNIFIEAVHILNFCVGVIILYSLLFMIGEVLKTLRFPFNIPYPIFSSAGSFFLVVFILNIMLMVQRNIGQHILPDPFFMLLPFLVALIVLVVGYVGIFLPKKEEKRIHHKHIYDHTKSHSTKSYGKKKKN